METTYLMSKTISSALNRRKVFHLFRVLFELSDFQGERDRKKAKDKVLKNVKFLTLYFLKTIFLVFFSTVF